ncbi:MAG: outer membrane protein insertion porin family [Spirosomataceae bacterium]|jgi:outer membrane protein insertion porin family
MTSSNLSIKTLIAAVFFFGISFLSNAQLRLGIGNSGRSTAAQSDFSYERPQEYVIGGITVSGVKFLDPNTLISVSGLSVNDKVTVPGERISTAIRRLMDQGIIEDVAIDVTKIEGKKIFLDINLKERPRLYKLQLQGIRKSERETVEEKIAANKGKVITEALVKNIQLTIKKYFIDKGYLNTTVQAQQTTDSIRANNATLILTIDKKDKVKINDIELNGIKQMPEWKVLAKMKGTKERAPLRIFTPSKFVNKKFKEDKVKLVDWYNKKGYRNARIISDSIYATKDDNLNIILNIDEGNRFYYRDISWTGNYLHASDTLNLILGIQKGDLYNPEELNKKINGIPAGDISSFYMDDGYLYFSCIPVEVAIEGDSIDIEMRIFEGKQAMINRIVLNGNTKTSDKVVMREILTRPGQKFSKTDLIETTQMLSKLGYFDPQTINPRPVPQADGTVNIEYDVEEKSSDNIELSGGWGGFQGLVGTFGVVFNNFSLKNVGNFKEYRPLPKGDGQRLAVRVQANGGFQNYSISFTEPWLGGKKPNSFTVSIFHSVQDYSKVLERLERQQSGLGGGFGGLGGLGGFGGGFGGLGNSFFRNTGASVTFGKRLNWPDRNFSFSTSLAYQYYDVKNSFLIRAFQNGQANDISATFNLSRYSLDNPQFTRNGSSFNLAASFTPPYSLFRDGLDEGNGKWLEGQRWMLDADWYTPVVGKLVFHAKANMGFMGRYNENIGYNPFGRFVLGGAGLGMQQAQNIGAELIGLRGYDEGVVYQQTLAEQAAAFDPSNNANQGISRQGGIIYSKYAMELRYPVSLNPQATIFILGFAEAGNSWGSYRDFNPFQLRRTAGVGARIFMAAFGLLGLDYGYAFDPIPGITNKGVKAFTFSIGQQIR